MPEKKQLYEKLAPVEADTPELYEAFDFVFDTPDITNIAVCGAFGSGKSSIMLGALKREDGRRGGALHHITVSLAHFDNDETPVFSAEPDSATVGVEETMETINGDDGASNTQTIEYGIAGKAANQHRTVGNATDDELALEANLLSQIIHQIDVSHAKHSKLLKKREAAMWQKVALFIGFFLLSLAGVVLAFPEQVSFFASDEYLPIVEVIAVIVFAVSLAIIIAGVMFGAVFSGIIHRFEVPGVGSAELFNADNDKEPSSLDRYLDDILYLLRATKTDVVIFEDLDRWGEKKVLEKLRQINTLLNSSSSFKKPKRMWGKDSKPVRFFYLLKDDIFESKDRVKFFDYIIAVFPYSDFNNAASRLMERLEKDEILINSKLLSIVGRSVTDSRLLKNIVNEFHQFRSWSKIEDNTAEQNERIFCLVVYKNLYPNDFARLQFGEGYLHALLHARRDLIEHIVSETAKSNEDGAKENSIALQQSLNAKSIGMILFERPDLEDRFFSLELSSDVLQTKNTIHDDALVRYFIKKGYIDNHCWAHISRAQEVIVSSHDYVFIQTVITDGKTDPAVKLDNPEGIIESLETYQFANPNTRVYELVTTLLDGDYRDEESSFFEGLKSDDDKAFVMGFLQSGLCHDKAIRRIENRFPDALFYEEGIMNMEHEELRAQIRVVLNATNNVAKLNPGLKKRLKHIISEDVDFLGLIEDPDDSLVSKLANLDVEMYSINFKKTQDEVLAKAAELGLFYPNAEMISSLLGKVNRFSPISYNSMLSAVYENLDTILGNSIDNKIERLVTSLLNDENYNPDDTVAAVTWMLNHEDIGDDHKQRYIELVPTSSLSLETVDESIWESLLENNVAAFSVRNIAAYYDKYAGAFDSTLITFFNEHVKPGVINMQNKDVFNDVTVFLKDLVAQEDLDDETFEIVFSEYGEIPSDIAINSMTAERQAIMFAHGCFSMEVNRLDTVRRQYPEHLDSFILLKAEKYLDLVVSGNIAPSRKEVLLLLKAENLNDDKKKQLLDNTAERFSISEKYSDEINAYLVNNHFDRSDLQERLGSFYEGGDDELKAAITDVVISTLQSGYQEVALPGEAMTSVLAAPSLAENTKVSLLVQCLRDYTSPEVIEQEMRAAGFINEANLMHGGSKKIRPSESEKVLIDHLQNAGCLGKMVPISSDLGSYMLYGKKVVGS